MNDSKEPARLHGSHPPRPSIFPVIAVAVLGGGAYAANAARPAIPGWTVVAAGAAGLAACLIVLRAGQNLFGSRRAGVYAGLILAACAPLLRTGPFSPAHFLFVLLALPALGLGRLLDRYSEGQLGAVPLAIVRFSLDAAGTAAAAGAVVLLLRPTALAALLPGRHVDLHPVPVACFALAGMLIGFMGLAGEGRRWPLAEAVLVSAAAGAAWLGLVVQ